MIPGAKAYFCLSLAPLLASGVLEIIALPPAHVELYLADTLSPDTRAEAVAWVTRSAQATSAYLGRFPVYNPKITLLPVSGRGISSGLTYNGPLPSIRVQVGKGAGRFNELGHGLEPTDHAPTPGPAAGG